MGSQEAPESEPDDARPLPSVTRWKPRLVFGLVAFEYDFLTDIASTDGLVYWVAISVRMATWLSTLAVSAALAEIRSSSRAFSRRRWARC